MSTQMIKAKILEQLNNVKREGMTELIGWLNSTNFFTSPASARFHLCRKGGLAEHSWDVFWKLRELYLEIEEIDQPMAPGQKPLIVTEENIIIAGLLHDVNKVDLYKPTRPGSRFKYYCDKQHPKGHGELSVKRISNFIPMHDIEKYMIRFHMGIYGTFEMDDYCAEYPLKNVHSEEEKNWSKAEKEADKEKRYCSSLRNCWYHNPICKLLSIADELATLEEKCVDYARKHNG